MFIAKVRGNVVTTQKVEPMLGRKLLIVEPLCVDEPGDDLFSTNKSFVAVDAVGAGADDMVLVTQGSSARMTHGMGDAPVDCVIIGIIDTIGVAGKKIYRKSES